MKKILVFTGAGVSKESGINTFRDNGGLWDTYKVSDVATMQAWYKNRKLVLDFYNSRRKELKTVKPNRAHEIIAELSQYFDVSVITQNVDNLHEVAGSNDVIHLHGELNKVRSTVDSSLVYDWTEDVLIGDNCDKGSQLRPHIVWFGENLNNNLLNRSKEIAEEADVCVIVGTSMQVFPASDIPFHTRRDIPVYYVDPSDMNFNIGVDRKVIHIKENATIGMEKVKQDLLKMIED